MEAAIYISVFLCLSVGISRADNFCNANDLRAMMVRLQVLTTEVHNSVKAINTRLENLEKTTQQIKESQKQIIVPMVAFTAYWPKDKLVGEGVPIFSYIVENSGGGYDKATGVFTCTLPGLYHFYVNLLVQPSSSTGYASCYLVRNASTTVAALVGLGSSTYLSASASAYLHLSAADTVHLRCTKWDYIYHGPETIFTGALITPE